MGADGQKGQKATEHSKIAVPKKAIPIKPEWPINLNLYDLLDLITALAMLATSPPQMMTIPTTIIAIALADILGNLP